MLTAKPVGRARGHAIADLFGRSKAIIGVVHLRPLPGAPRYDGAPVEEVYAQALADAEAYAAGGVDGLIVENHGDIPFAKPEDIGPETAATMAVAADRVRRAVPLPVGINVLANAAVPALAVAKAAGAAFVRVNQWANAYVANEGLVEGAAARALRYRAALRANDEVRVFADAHVKHGAHAIVADRPLEELVRDVEFFEADAVIATGHRTGDAAEVGYVRRLRAATHLPLLIGSGVTVDNVADLLAVADGAIVATSLKYDGVWWNAVDRTRVETLMREVRRLRGE
jgi:uncharacterized protein